MNSSPYPTPSPQFRAVCDQRFNESCDGKPYLNGIDAAHVFFQSGVHKTTLSQIWERADSNRDGRLNRDEFTVAMWLIETHKTQTSHQVPNYPPQPLQYSYMRPPPPVQPYQPVQSGNVGHGNESLAVTIKEMTNPLICSGCNMGLLPNDVVYSCDLCANGENAVCEKCHSTNSRCQHQALRVRLKAAENLPNEDKNGDLGFGLKCDKCKIKLKDGMLCWHCKRCFDPNFCHDCWRDASKRCKHASSDKIQLRRVGKSSVSSSEALDIVSAVGSFLG